MWLQANPAETEETLTWHFFTMARVMLVGLPVVIWMQYSPKRTLQGADHRKDCLRGKYWFCMVTVLFGSTHMSNMPVTLRIWKGH